METCHINLIALEPDNLITPFYHRKKYLLRNAPKYRHLLQYDENEPDYERFYTPQCINEMLLGGRRKGFFTIYNHPSGSLEDYPAYSQYHYMHAMEMYNGKYEYNPRVYDDLLRQGKRIFVSGGDEAVLKPMILEDIAKETGYDISTISRVSNSKYAQLPWGIFPLKYFFNDGVTMSDGAEISVRELYRSLRELVDNEDKNSPLTDNELMEKLQEQGFTMARRTVAKYREQLHIPVARLRKE